MSASTVVLWDIDGTLVRSAGVGVRAFVMAVQRAAGLTWTPHRLDFGGRTDPEIASLILADAGCTDPSLVDPVLVALVEAYEELADDLRASIKVLPGVTAALDLLAGRQALQTVVTGNLQAVARAKVTAGDLDRHLRLELGGYGSDHAERAELVRRSLARVADGGPDVDPRAVWVVGDTPRDLACARANDVRCALVATGTYSFDDLAALGADLVLADLSDAEPLLEAMALG